jgi:hypothetical protein
MSCKTLTFPERNILDMLEELRAVCAVNDFTLTLLPSDPLGSWIRPGGQRRFTLRFVVITPNRSHNFDFEATSVFSIQLSLFLALDRITPTPGCMDIDGAYVPLADTE